MHANIIKLIFILFIASFKLNKFFGTNQSNTTTEQILLPGDDDAFEKSLSDGFSSYEEHDSGSEYLPNGENKSDKSVASQQIPSSSHAMDLSFSTSLLDEMNSSKSEKSVDIELVPRTSHIMTSSFTTTVLDDINSFTSDKQVAPELIPSSSEINVSMNNVPMKTVSKNFSLVAEVEKCKKSNLTNKRIWDKLDHCLFCETDVTNFTRHLIRKHKAEIEVSKYEALPKGSKQRLALANSLRKRGNFLNNVAGNKIKPVRRPYEFNTSSVIAGDYLPCKYCYGMYKKKYLSRHITVCSKYVKTDKEKTCKAQSSGQNMLVAFIGNNKQLEETVFPRMASDEISFVAKSDQLITSFGTRYLKSHKEKHLIAVVSQKLRTLARFLIAMRSENGSISTLKDCLFPHHFDLVIKCSKKVARYDEKNDSFGSPSVILKLGQMLKQCCDLAEFLSLKQSDSLSPDTSQKERESINNFKYMIEKQWSFELSTNACKEIYQNKWNKPAILPLTSDIKLFRDYIISVEKEAYHSLKLNPDNMSAFKELQESIMVQIVLLNRRRAGEVQRILLDTYINAPSEVSQEEISHALSPVELELTKSFKRIVIRGKRGRGVPILFTVHQQKRLSFLLKLRESASFINNENPFLFPLTQCSTNCMRASDVIRKFGQKSGAEHPENITSTRLRKHVATVSQLLNLSDGDIEQLATFMGHTKDIHKHFYRLTDNAFQVNILHLPILIFINIFC